MRNPLHTRRRDRTSFHSLTSSRAPAQFNAKDVQIIFEDQNPLLDIICIDGLRADKWSPEAGSADTRWYSLIARCFAQARILYGGFRVHEAATHGTEFLEKCTEQCVDSIDKLRSQQDRPAIFIAHSLGGQIAARYCTKHVPRTSRNVALVFLATPHFTDFQKWRELDERLSLLNHNRIKLDRTTLDHLIQVEASFRDWLESNTGDGKHPNVICFFETLKTQTAGEVLSEESACIEGCKAFPLERDHLTMISYNGIYDPEYQKLCNRVRTLLRQAKRKASTVSLSVAQPALLKDIENPRLTAFSDFEQQKWAREVVAGDQELSDLLEFAYRCDINVLPKDAVAAYAKISAICAERGEKDQMRLYCKERQSLMYLDSGDLDDAYDTINEVEQERRKQALEAGDLSRWYLTMANKARILRYRGEFNVAYDCLREALLWIRGSLYRSTEGIILVSVLAKVLKDQGLYEICELLSRDIVRACFCMLGETAYSLNRESDMSVVFAKLRKFEAAEAVARRVLSRFPTVLPEKHRHILRTQKRLGSFLRFQGRHEEAIEILEQTVDDQEVIFHGGHADLISTKCSLAASLACVGRLKEAQSLLSEALSRRKGQYTPEIADRNQDVQWATTAYQIVSDQLIKDLDSTEEEQIMDENAKRFFERPTEAHEFDKVNRTQEFETFKYEHRRLRDFMEDFDDEDSDFDLSKASKTSRLAAASGHQDRIEQLAEKYNINEFEIGGFWGDTIQAAAFAGNEDMLKYLVEKKKLDVNAQCGLFGFPLRAAALQGRVSVVEFLLNNGADPNARDEVLGSALQAAFAGGHPRVVDKLLAPGSNAETYQDIVFGTPLQEAVLSGDVGMVKLLLQYGIHPNTDAGIYGSAWGLAAAGQRTDMLKELLCANEQGPTEEQFQQALQKAMDVRSVGNVLLLLDYAERTKKHEARIAEVLSGPNAPVDFLMKILKDQTPREDLSARPESQITSFTPAATPAPIEEPKQARFSSYTEVIHPAPDELEVDASGNALEEQPPLSPPTLERGNLAPEHDESDSARASRATSRRSSMMDSLTSLQPWRSSSRSSSRSSVRRSLREFLKMTELTPAHFDVAPEDAVGSQEDLQPKMGHRSGTWSSESRDSDQSDSRTIKRRLQRLSRSLSRSMDGI